MARVNVIWNESAIKLSCANPSSPVGRAMATLAGETVQAMKREAPVAPHDRPATARWPGRRSGTLRSSVRHFRQPDGNFIIGPTDRVDGQFLAELVVRGTRPHSIDAHGPWSLHSAVTGRYFGPHVDHPGTRPNDFIGRAVARMNGRRVRAT